jgi:hypothetical protein
MHPMEILGDVGLVESQFSPFRYSVTQFGPFRYSASVGAREVHGFR